ncbi:fluoride efflux transporter CrcB [Rickettsiales bacterium]|jgi:fluoride exporter|nr:fluoride efflux transporter CrcB [Rickettsiales bacterium]|tara:strand:+ start:3031 stop:3426 length:396 start_codon:yes stop_codon:yes gene_type:complete
MTIFFIAIGGALGSILRYLLTEFSFKLLKNSNLIMAKLPLGTMSVNILGSFIAGLIYYFLVKNFNNFDPKIKSFLLTGLLGGFTTFSAFSLDILRLINAKQINIAVIYLVASILLSLFAIFLGFYIAKFID